MSPIRSPIRIVLDTNLLVSALLFQNGRLAWLRRSWQTGTIRPVLAELSARELIRVLAYPKFRLTPPDINRLLGHVLPWCETNAGSIEPTQHLVRRPHLKSTCPAELPRRSPSPRSCRAPAQEA